MKITYIKLALHESFFYPNEQGKERGREPCRQKRHGSDYRAQRRNA
jgi:hypothetical protein